jgi:hypothetical protein
MNDIHRIPPEVLGATAVLLFTLGALLVAAHTAVLALTAPHATPSPRARTVGPLVSGAFLAVWLAVAIAVADGVNFAFFPEALRLPVSLAVGFGPMLIALALLFGSRFLEDVVRTMEPAWPIWLQTYRVAGLMFIYPFLHYGVVPAGFAIPAAVGDFVVGLAAPFVGYAVYRRRSRALGWTTAWNAFGILDLIVAPTAAVLSHARVAELYPLALVALFIGPPLGILTHVVSLRNLRSVAWRASGREARMDSAAGDWAPTAHR